MKNIAETVFNEFEEEAFLKESENTELPNPAEHLYTNEQDLNLDISNMINFQLSIFNSNSNNNEREESSNDESSDEDDEDDEYDMNEIVTSIADIPILSLIIYRSFADHLFNYHII
ncbi:unnamed protein product [Rhizophagus irregularis]|nr:unnamed protein product [Rhizophagus irregularis]